MDPSIHSEHKPKRLKGKEAAEYYSKLIMPYFKHISPNQLEQHVLPMIPNDTMTPLSGRKIYDDSAIPADIQTSFKWLEVRTKLLVHGMCVAVPWMLARYSASYVLQKDFKAGLNLFDRKVLSFALLLSLPIYPLLNTYLSNYKFVLIDKCMLADRRDRKLSMYRKRFVEALPDYISDKYREDKQLIKFDKIKLNKEAREAKFITPDVTSQNVEGTEHQPLEKDLSGS
jgi:hypothetical protein